MTTTTILTFTNSDVTFLAKRTFNEWVVEHLEAVKIFEASMDADTTFGEGLSYSHPSNPRLSSPLELSAEYACSLIGTPDDEFQEMVEAHDAALEAFIEWKEAQD